MRGFFYTQKPWMVFVDLVLLLVLYCIFQPASRGKMIPSSRNRLGVFVILLFCLFSFWGTDWFHYLDFFIQQKHNPNDTTIIEGVYLWLISRVAPNYVVFRLIIWGGSLLLLSSAINRIGLDKNLTWFIFVSMSLIWFSYARVTLAMSLMFFGASLIYDASKRFSLLRLFIGFAIIAVSYFFHKSSVFGIGIIVVSVLMSRLNTKTYILFIVLLPLLVYLVSSYIGDFLMMDIDEEGNEFGTYMSSAQSYMEREQGVKGMGAILQRVLEIIPYYLSAILCIKLQNRQQFSTFPKAIRFFTNVLLLIVVTSSVFLFDVGANTHIMYIRFMRFGFIPMVIVLAYCWENQCYIRFSKRTFWIGCFSTLYAVSYSLYNAILH